MPHKRDADDFFALDVETSNSNFATICQIGIVKFENGISKLIYKTFVNPEDTFSRRNISVHGIRPDDVEKSPNWKDIYPVVESILKNQIVAHHTHFDRSSVNQACARYDLPTLNCQWLDTASVVRRAWPEFSQRGYGLAPMAARLGIAFTHHDAAEDARAAGEILLKAILHSNYSCEEWIAQIYKRAS